MPAVLDQIVDAIQALLVAIEEDAQPLFANVYLEGDVINETAHPFAEIHIGNEEVVGETNSHLYLELIVQVIIDFARPGSGTPQARARQLLGLVQATFGDEGNWYLGGLLRGAIRYHGRGSLVVPTDDDSDMETSNHFAIGPQFKVPYQYRITDPNSAT